MAGYICAKIKRMDVGAITSMGINIVGGAHLSEDGSIDPSYSVHNFQLLSPSTPAEIEAYKDWTVGDKMKKGGKVWEVIFRSGKFVVCVNSSGSATANYTCEELYNDGWRLVAEEDRDVHESGKT